MKNKKQTKIETIFDHNPTEYEIRRIAPEVLHGNVSKEEYPKWLNRDTHFYQIYRLYKCCRNDIETAKKYYLMISEKERKRSEKMARETIKA